MFRGDLIIDGYNVLHAADLALPASSSGGLERARGSLLQLISDKLTPRERNRTTVVFDSPVQPMGPSPPRELHQLLVMFAGWDGDADATIERLIRQNSAPRRLCVVSSDHRLQKAARRRRAKFLDSDVFLTQLARRTPRTERRTKEEPAAKRSGRLPPSEVDAWLRVFEDVEDLRFPLEARPANPVESRQPSPPARPPRDTRREPGRKSTTAADDADAASLNEISFWESRISELDIEERGS